MRIIVGGYIVGYPLGGLAWHHLNYVAGLAEMGHDVWFYEDSGKWSYPYNPLENTVSDDPAYGLEFLTRSLKPFGLDDKYCYYSELQDSWYGVSRDRWHAVLQGADVLLCVSGITPWRDEFSCVDRTCVIDTDPVYTQLRMLSDPAFVDYYRRFDRAATFGRMIGTPTCRVPTAGISWIPTNQPVALSEWPLVPWTAGAFSTLGRWDHGTSRKFTYEGKSYESSKGVQWMKLLDLPRLCSAELGMSMSDVPDDVRRLFIDAGWTFTDPVADSMTTDAYRNFIQRQSGEFTVAKQIYVDMPSGWFSDRSACYLASGKPVITQPTGFSDWIPSGEGLLSYDSVESAAAALDAVHSDPVRHSTAARAIAEEFFDARKVLTQLLHDLH